MIQVSVVQVLCLGDSRHHPDKFALKHIYWPTEKSNVWVYSHIKKKKKKYVEVSSTKGFEDIFFNDT